MKTLIYNIILIFLTSISLHTLSAQVAISSDGNATPNSSSVLDLQSGDKGMLIPRLTTYQRNKIINPAKGLLIFNTDDQCFNYHIGNGDWFNDCGKTLNQVVDSLFMQSGSSSTQSIGIDLEIDHDGYIYFIGVFIDDLTLGDTTISSSGSHLFISKLRPDGTAQWLNKVTVPFSQTSGTSITYDNMGNVFCSGRTTGTFVFGSDTIETLGGGSVGFVLKYDANGNEVWAAQTDNGYATNGHSGFNKITSDQIGNIYGCGFFQGQHLIGSDTIISQGASDWFVSKLDSNGQFLWTSAGGGQEDDRPRSIVANPDGSTFVCGVFADTMSFGGLEFVSSGNTDNLLIKLNQDGALMWARQNGGQNSDQCKDVDIDQDGHAIIVGTFHVSAMFGATSVSSNGGSATYIAKYDSNGELVWVTNGKSPVPFSFHSPESVAVDRQGSIFVTGEYRLSATLGDTVVAGGNPSDVITFRCSKDGQIEWVRTGAGPSFDYGIAIAVNQNSQPIITGRYREYITFDTTTLTSSTALPTSSELFLVQYGSQGRLHIDYLNHLDASQDIDSDPTNELQTWSNLPGIPGGFSDDTDDVNDADSNPTNEIQTLDEVLTVGSNGDGLGITNLGPVGIGTAPATRLHIVGGSDASLTSNGFLMMGNSTGANLIVDQNEVMSRNNGLGSTLFINQEGGNVVLAGQANTGNIGIGTSSPVAKLDVNGNAQITGQLTLQDTVTLNERMIISHSSMGVDDWAVLIETTETSFVGGMRMENNGFLNMTNNASGTGPNYARLSSSGAWSAVSDIRLKNRIQPAKNLLEKAMKIRPVNYHFKSLPEGELELGFIAQEVNQVLPELVEEGEHYTLNYSGISVVAIGAIQEQQKQIESQQQQINELMKMIENQKELVNQLIKAMPKTSFKSAH